MIYFLFRRRTLFLFIAPLVLLAIARTTPSAFWIGLPFVVVGEGIRVWSASYLTKLSKLVTAGPFALCRNPLYVGSFLVSVGYFIMCNRLDAWIVGVFLFWLFHGGAIVYEEHLLRESFGKEFDDYCSRVPRFVPKLACLQGEGNCSMKQFLMNNEYRGVAAAILLSGLFALIAYVPQYAPLALMTK